MLLVCLQPALDLLELLKSIHANYVPSNIAAVLGKWLLQHCDMTYLLVVAFFLLLPLQVRLRSGYSNPVANIDRRTHSIYGARLGGHNVSAVPRFAVLCFFSHGFPSVLSTCIDQPCLLGGAPF